MTTDDPRLLLLGEALRDAAAADLSRTAERAAHTPSSEARTRRRSRPKARIGTRTAAAFLAAALAVPAAAIAVGVFGSEQKVAESIPAGNFSFAGTEPTCTTVREGLEYDCVLDRPPSGEVPPESGRFVIKPGEWLGVVEPTADQTKHVNGGCRSQNAQGTRWLCFLGKESVRQDIMAPAALGEYLPSPAGP
ncbi:MAG TPA: hypothetical protein VHA54_00160 [Solirubrobacterales bacterium]|nr:hypothetical protein [Solirubrobacterales bacterium]